MLRHASSSLASLHGGKNLLDLRIQLNKLQSKHALTGMQHQVERPGQFVQVLPNQSTHAPADSVPHHCSTQHLAYGQADTRTSRTVIFTIEGGHVPRKMFSALLVNRLKVSMLQQTRVPGEAL